MKLLLITVYLLFAVWASNAQTVTFSKRIAATEFIDMGWSVVETDDGYVVWAVGVLTDMDNYYGAFVINTDLEGNVKWTKRFGQSGYAHWLGYAKSFHRYKGGFIGCGTKQGDNVWTYSNPFLIRYDENGDTIWFREFGGAYFDASFNCSILPNGNIAVAGTTGSLGDTLGDFYLFVVDSSGSLIIEKKYGGTNRDVAINVDQTQDNGFVLGGKTLSAGLGSYDNLLIKTDSVGTLEWNKTFGTLKEDCGLEVRTSRYGGYYVWGCMDTLRPSATGTTPYVAKLDSDGNILWRKFFPQTIVISIWDFEELLSGDIAFLGSKNAYEFGPEVAWIVKMDSNGIILWEKTHQYLENPSSNPVSAWARGFCPTNDGGFIITGMCSVGWNDVDTSGQDVWLLKLDSMGCLVPGCDTLVPCPTPCDTTGITETTTLQAKLYPNPTTGTLTIELPGGQGGGIALYNLLGQSVFHSPVNDGQTTLDIDLPQGVYIYRIEAGGKVVNGRLLVE